MEIVTEITLTNLTYVRISLNILLTLITRYKTDPAFVEKIKNTINEYLLKIYKQDEKTCYIYEMQWRQIEEKVYQKQVVWKIIESS